MKQKDITGNRYGRLVAIRRIGSEPTKYKDTTIVKSVWEFKCDCGNVIQRYWNKVQQGDTRSCGCLRSETTSRRSKLPKGESAFNNLFSQRRSSAKQRNIEWFLTKKQFIELSKKPCHYCGLPPSAFYLPNSNTNGACVYSGIDRVDNNKSYSIDNVVPCCKECNFAKRAMSADEFLAWINRVYRHQEKLHGE